VLELVRAQQILWSLVRNAVTFTPDGGRFLIRTYNPNALFHLEVSETGVASTATRSERFSRRSSRRGATSPVDSGGWDSDWR
jgi:hypothetical protein